MKRPETRKLRALVEDEDAYLKKMNSMVGNSMMKKLLYPEGPHFSIYHIRYLYIYINS